MGLAIIDGPTYSVSEFILLFLPILIMAYIIHILLQAYLSVFYEVTFGADPIILSWTIFQKVEIDIANVSPNKVLQMG